MPEPISGFERKWEERMRGSYSRVITFPFMDYTNRRC